MRALLASGRALRARCSEGPRLRFRNPQTTAEPSPHALLTADDLYSRLCNEDHVSGRLIVIEVVPTGHVGAVPPIPGSQRVWRPDYQLPISSSQPLDGLAPTAESFEAFAQRLGVNEDSEVILISERYDDTRLWWLFVAFGKRSVYILDGGFTEWERRVAARPLASLEKTKGTVKHARGTWKAQPFNTQLLATRPSVSRLRTAAKPRLWDVRTRRSTRVASSYQELRVRVGSRGRRGVLNGTCFAAKTARGCPHTRSARRRGASSTLAR